ncbi:MAG: prepilin-type N-terminal cleavage/methylation domain-containing protein [bacterium]
MRKGFTLIEIMTCIGIVALAITVFLIAVYSIQIAQYKTMFGDVISKKAEFQIYLYFSRMQGYVLYGQDIATIVYEVIRNNLKRDQDLREIEIEEISVEKLSPQEVRRLHLANKQIDGDEQDEDPSNDKKIYKIYYKCIINYKILSTRKRAKTDFVFPVYFVQELYYNPRPPSQPGNNNYDQDQTVSSEHEV